MKGSKAASIILVVEILSFFAQYTFGLSRNYASIFDALTFFISLCLLLFIKLSDYRYRWKIKSVISIVVLVFISSISNIDSFGFGSVMTIGRFLIYYLLLDNIYIGKKIKKIILAFGGIQLCLLQIVDLSTYNPNTVGLVYLIIGIEFALLLNPLYCYQRFFYYLIIAIVGYLLIMTETRSCLIAYIFFVFMLLLPPIIWKKKYVLIAGMLALTIGSLLYVHIYVYLWEASVVDSELIAATVENTGKTFFSGRQEIWQECINLLYNNLLFGTGSKIRLYSFESVNLHNTMLNFFLIYGSIVGFLVIYLMCRSVYELFPYSDDKRIHNCISANFAFLIVSVFETNLLVFSFMSLFPLMVAYSLIKKEVSK